MSLFSYSFDGIGLFGDIEGFAFAEACFSMSGDTPYLLLGRIMASKVLNRRSSCGEQEGQKVVDQAVPDKNGKASSKKAGYIKAVCDAAGWSVEDATDKIEQAHDAGLPYYAYVKNQCWNMTFKEIQALVARRRERDAAFISEVRERSGCDEETAKQKLRQADKSKLKRKSYLKYCGWDLSDEELAELAEALKLRRQRMSADNSFYADAVERWSGWSRDAVLAHMEDVRARGLSYSRYVQYACWSKSEEEIELLCQLRSQHSSGNKTKKEDYIATIREKTGWSEGKVHLEVMKAQAAYGFSYEDYFGFCLHELSPEKQRYFVSLWDWNKLKAWANDNALVLRTFNDKAEFNRLFDSLIKRAWFVNRNLSYEEFLMKIDGLSCVIVKPLAATQGIGITKYPCNVSEEGNKELYNLIMDKEESIVEEYIVQHDEMMAFCPNSVNTIRMTTVSDDDGVHCLYAILRMGIGSVVDNFHAGGIAAGVNVSTGVVETDAIDLQGNVYTKNPATGKQIRGFKVPHWDKLLQACQDGSEIVPDVRLIGWDFAITPDGVDLVEGNGGSGYVAAQMIYSLIGQGLRGRMIEPYLG